VTIDVDDPRWFAFAERMDEAGPVHHPAWSSLIADCYGYNAFNLVVMEQNAVVAGAPVIEVRRPLRGRRWVSLPFTDSCQPLAQSVAARELFEKSLDEARRRSGADSFELRWALDTPSAQRFEQAYRHTLELQSDPDAVFRRFKRTQVQQRIRKAERSGLRVREGTSLDVLRIFYSLHVETRRRLGVPVQPFRFFKLFAERLFPEQLAYVLVASLDEKPIAAAVFLRWNRKVLYKYSASLAEYRNYRPNNLLLWEAIKAGCLRGDGVLDFGRSDFGDEGLRAFKAGWGTSESTLVYSTLSSKRVRPPRTATPAFVRAILRRTPRVTTRLVGAVLYKYTA
jgi:lipid II:glycine glycyltransferase (peptidoglycan interpeptide bridge formation enzyme)